MFIHFKMKLSFKLFLFLVACFGSNFGQRLTFIGSYFASPNEYYKSVILANGVKNLNLAASFQGSNKIAFPNLIQMKDFNEINVNVPQEGSDGIKLEIKADRCDQKSVKLINTSDRSLVFIHFDKPIYKTGEEFKFRIFVLDKNLKPNPNHKNIEVLIYDSNEYPIKFFNDISTSKFGVFEGALKLADEPNLGKWKIQAFVGDKKVTKSFSVYKPDENGLEVAVDSPSIVAHIDRRLYITIHVKDNIDKFFVGTADIFVKAKFKKSNKNEIDQHVKTVDINGNKKVIGIDFQDELGIRFPTADMILEFDIAVKDEAMKRSITVNKKIEMKYKGRNTIQVNSKKYFKPNFKFNARVKVKVLDGRLDNSFNQLSVTVKYINKNSKIVEEKFQINLKAGETMLNLQPKIDTAKISLDLKFAEVEHSIDIDRFPGIEEYMQVSPTNKISSSSDKATFVAKASEDMELLHVVVAGTQGIIFSRDFPDSIGKDIVNFEVPISDEMKPEARGLAFYIRNGGIVYDEFSIIAGFSVDNVLDITSPEIAKPNELITYDVKTESGSQVYITAVDHSPTTLNRENEISRADVYNELIYYVNLKFPNASRYHFEKFNGLVFEPFVNGKCSKKVLSSEIVESGDEDDNIIPTNYFPEIMINDNYEAKSSNLEKRSIKVPDSLTTWQIFGISVHPDRGFKLAKVQSKLMVKKDLAVQLRSPVSAYDTEAFKVEVRVYSSLNERVSVQGTIRIENGFIVEKTQKTEFGLACEKLNPTGPKQKPLTMNLLPEQISKPTKFLIKPSGNGNVIIKVSESGGNNRDDAEKIIEIRKPGNHQSINANKKIYGSLLDPSLNGLEKMFDRPMITDEEKMLKFTMAITNYKFMKESKKLSEEISKKAHDDIIVGYQEAIVILENILQQNDHKFTWLASMTVQNLIDAQSFTSIDGGLITGALNFIKFQQDRGGKFKYDENSDYHRNIGNGFRSEIQSALIIAAFLKDETSKTSNSAHIQKTVNMLKAKGKSWENYPKIIAAYTLALSGDTTAAKAFLRDVNSASFTNVNPEFNAVSIEIASYIILTKILLHEDPQDEVKWLLSQRNSDGKFYSLYDTVLAYQALYEFTFLRNMRTQEFQSSQARKANDIDAFSLEFKEDLGEKNQIKMNFKITNHKREFEVSNLAVVEIELPRGYRYIDYTVENNIVEKDALQNDRNTVIFYINKIEKNQPFTLIVNVLKIFDYENHVQSTIKIYDYYRSNIRSIYTFTLDTNIDNCEKIIIGKQLTTLKNTAEEIQKRTGDVLAKLEGSKISLTDVQNNVQTAIKNTNNAKRKLEDANRLKKEIYDDTWKILNATEKVLNTLNSFESQNLPEDSNNEEQVVNEKQTDGYQIPQNEESSWEPRGNYTNADDVNKDMAIVYKMHSDVKSKLETAKNHINKMKQELNMAKEDFEVSKKRTITSQNELNAAQNNFNDILKHTTLLKSNSTELLKLVEEYHKTIIIPINVDIEGVKDNINSQQMRIQEALKNVTNLIKSVKDNQSTIQTLIKDIRYEQNQAIRIRKAFELSAVLERFRDVVKSVQDGLALKNPEIRFVLSSSKRVMETFNVTLTDISGWNNEAKNSTVEMNNFKSDIQLAQNELKNVEKKFESSLSALQIAQKNSETNNKAFKEAEKNVKNKENSLNLANMANDDVQRKYDAISIIQKELINKKDSFSPQKNTTDKLNAATMSTNQEIVTTVSTIAFTTPKNEVQSTISTNLTHIHDQTGHENNKNILKATTTTTPKAVATIVTKAPGAIPEHTTKTMPISSNDENSEYNSQENCSKWFRFCTFGL